MEDIRKIKKEDVKWRTFSGLAGDPDHLLIGTYNDTQFSALYNTRSLFNISLWLARKKILSAINLLHIV